jgi:hypothetical protein
MNNPDRLLHVFSTYMGLPPDADDGPICGATLTSAYDARNAPKCPHCLRLMLLARQVETLEQKGRES